MITKRVKELQNLIDMNQHFASDRERLIQLMKKPILEAELKGITEESERVEKEINALEGLMRLGVPEHFPEKDAEYNKAVRDCQDRLRKRLLGGG